MTANELRNQTFDKSAFGFKTDEVSECLMEAARSLESLERRNKELQMEISELKQQQSANESDLDASAESMKEILLNAQKLSSNVVSEAKGKANTLLEDARQKSETMVIEATGKSKKMLEDAEMDSKRITSEATTKANDMLKEAERKVYEMSGEAQIKADKEQARLETMQKEVSAFKSKLLNIYKSHLDLITKLPDEKKKDSYGQEQPQVTKSEPSGSDSITSGFGKYEEEKPSANKYSNPQNNTNHSNNSNSADSSADSKFKIKITEKETPAPPKAQAQERPKNPDYKSRFGELKFGEHTK